MPACAAGVRHMTLVAFGPQFNMRANIRQHYLTKRHQSALEGYLKATIVLTGGVILLARGAVLCYDFCAQMELVSRTATHF